MVQRMQVPHTIGIPNTDLSSLLTLITNQGEQMQSKFTFLVTNQQEQLDNQQNILSAMQHDLRKYHQFVESELRENREGLSLVSRKLQEPPNATPSGSRCDRSPERSQFGKSSRVGTQNKFPENQFRGRNNQLPEHIHVQRQLFANYQAEQAPPQHHPTFHLKSAEIPRYTGSEDKKTPFDFLIELDKYKTISRSTDEFMVNEIAPLALQGQAFSWYRYEVAYSPFVSYDNFRVRFRREFQPMGYAIELSRELDNRSQGPTEPLTMFIRIIVDYYKRLDLDPPEAEIVARIKRQMHPEYATALQGKTLVTLRDLMDAAFEAQDQIKARRAYRPPPMIPGVEPSLGWKPPEPNSSFSRNEVPTFIPLPDRSNPVLHPMGIDPFTFFHAGQQQQQPLQNRQVSFRDPQTSSYQQQRPQTPVAIPRPNSDFRQRPNSPGQNNQASSPATSRPSTPNNQGPRLCFKCGSPDHLSPACDKSPRPGNARAPSPVRNGLGKNA
jgi:hypothetical protein